MGKGFEVIIMWTAEDIKTLRPNWTDEQCEEALQGMEKHLCDRSVEFGWAVIEELLDD